MVLLALLFLLKEKGLLSLLGMKVHKNEHINKPVKGEGKIGAKTMCALEACKALDRHGKFLVKYGPPILNFKIFGA